MTTLNTHDILRLKESELVPALKALSNEMLEQHIQALIEELGGQDYGKVMRTVMNTLESDRNPENRFTLIQNTLRDMLPVKAHMSDIYERLASMIMLLIMRKYKRILEEKG